MFQQAGVTNVVFLWNPGYYADDANKDPHSFYPGNGYVDWIGIDTYPKAEPDTFITDFSQFYSDFSIRQYGKPLMVGYGKPLMVGENAGENMSVFNQELQVPYLQALLADIASGMYPQLKAYDYFDSPGNAPNDWVFDTQGWTEFATIATSGTVEIYANGFGATSVPVVSGSSMQSGTLSPLTTVTIGDEPATVIYAGLISPGLFQINVTVPSNAAAGDQPIVATYKGSTTQSGALLTVAGSSVVTAAR